MRSYKEETENLKSRTADRYSEQEFMNEGPKSRIRLKFARLKPAENFTHLEQIKAFRARALAS